MSFEPHEPPVFWMTCYQARLSKAFHDMVWWPQTSMYCLFRVLEQAEGMAKSCQALCGGRIARSLFGLPHKPAKGSDQVLRPLHFESTKRRYYSIRIQPHRRSIASL